MVGRGRGVVEEAHDKAPANHPGVFPNISGKTAAVAWFA